MASLSINTTLKLASGYEIPQLGFGVSKDHTYVMVALQGLQLTFGWPLKPHIEVCYC